MQTAEKVLNDTIRDIVITIGIGFIIGISTVFLSRMYECLWILRSIITGISLPLTILCVIAGLTIAYLIVQKFALKKETGCGTSQVIEAYHYERGYLSPRDFSSKTVASAVTIGFGGSAGLEGPSLLLGGGIASFIGQKTGLSPEKIRVFMVSGAAAGLSAIFKAPLTGILFALEIPYRRYLAKEIFITASLSSVTSYLTFIFFEGSEPLFPFSPVLTISLDNALYATIEGLLAAVVALFFIHFFRTVEKMRTNFKVHPIILPALGGLVVGSIGLMCPRILGVGYDTIYSSASGSLYDASMMFLVSLLIFKIIATSVTLNLGGSGGLFIPSIFVGAIMGVIFTKMLSIGPNEILVMAAMAAVIAATNKTLLTSIAFVAETCGPSSIISATIAACISYVASGSLSLYENQLVSKPEEEGEALTQLRHLIQSNNFYRRKEIRVKEIMVRNPVTLYEGMSIEEALAVAAQHEFRVYPVVNKWGGLIGTLKIEDLLSIPIEKWNLPISQTTIQAPLVALEEDSLYDIIEKMIQERRDHAYIVSDYHSMRPEGVVAGIDALRAFLKTILIEKTPKIVIQPYTRSRDPYEEP